MVAAIARKELLASGRQGRLFAIRAVHLVVLAGIAIPAILAQVRQSSIGTNAFAKSGAGLEFARVFGVVELIAILLMAPALAIGAISRERVEGSLDLLHAAGTRPIAIAGGKFAARVGILALFAISGFPMLLVGTLLGGIGGEMVLLIVCHTLAAAAVATAIGLAVSGAIRQTIPAIVVAYGLLFGCYAVAPLLAETAASNFGRTPLAGALVAAVSPIYAVAIAGSPGVPRLHEWLSLVTQLAAAAVLLLLAAWGSRMKEEEAARRISDAGVELLEGNIPRLRGKRPQRLSRAVTGNPIAWIDARAIRRNLAPRLVRLLFLIVGGSVAVLSLIFSILDRAPEDARAPLAFLICGAALVVVLSSSGAISSERERKTLGLLRLTSLSPGEIVAGKIGGLWAWLWPVAILPLIPALAFFLSTPFDTVIAIVMTAILLYTAASFGVMVSAFTRRAFVATIVSCVILIVVVVGPFVVLAFAHDSDATVPFVALFDPPFTVWAVASTLGRDPDPTVPILSAYTGLLLLFCAGSMCALVATIRVSRAEESA